MSIGASGQQSAFSFWIRTGRQPIYSADGSIEFKFNPWHDPENGQFTFAGQGRYYGRSSGGKIKPGGGRFGGGGASGGWASRRSRTSSRPATPEASPRPVLPNGPGTIEAAVVNPWPRTSNVTRVVLNGYEYTVDTGDRMEFLAGLLDRNNDQRRSRSAQAGAGGADRRPTDDGGHYIARRFNGPTDPINHFAQDSNFNRGRYRMLEEQWARAQKAGHTVYVEINPVYEGKSKRPSFIDVTFKINNKQESVKFPNEAKEVTRAKR
jgi:hypothetical protein